MRWNLASSYGSQIDVLGKNILRVIDNIKVMSDGNFDIRFFEPGALVPALEVFDAVSKGSVQAAYTTTGFAAGKIPHMIFFSSVPFGPNVNEYVAWIQHGGGYQLYEKGYAEHNIKGFQCGIVVAESSGWFREPIESLDDLKGLKMRFFGLGAQVMDKLGVSTQLMPGADIYPALERGVIDAAEFSYPSLDRAHGFYQIAKHNYFPGWHQQASFVELTMNLDAWKALPASYQKMVELACNDANFWLMGAAEASQGAAIAFHESPGRDHPPVATRIHRGLSPGLGRGGAGGSRRGPPLQGNLRQLHGVPSELRPVARDCLSRRSRKSRAPGVTPAGVAAGAERGAPKRGRNAVPMIGRTGGWRARRARRSRTMRARVRSIRPESGRRRRRGRRCPDQLGERRHHGSRPCAREKA